MKRFVAESPDEFDFSPSDQKSARQENATGEKSIGKEQSTTNGKINPPHLPPTRLKQLPPSRLRRSE